MAQRLLEPELHKEQTTMEFFDAIKKKVGDAAQQAYQQHAYPQEQYAPPPQQAEDDGGAGDDFRRDFTLEAQDDTAHFDLGNDIAGWWKAHREIEEGWEERPRRLQLLQKHGIRNEQHFYQVQETVNRFIAGVRLENAQATSAEAFHSVLRDYSIEDQRQAERVRQTAYRFAPQREQRERFGWNMGNIAQMQMNALTSVYMDQHKQRASGELAGELGPVEGVALKTWAAAQAALAGGKDLAMILGKLQIDNATWDRVSAEWMARMSRDATATVATEYGMAFSNSGEGMFSDAAAQGIAGMGNAGAVDTSQPAITLEQWVELMEAQGAAATQGRDANAVLAQYGMNALAWSNASAWWSTHFSQNAMKNGGELHQRFSQLSDFYKQKFAAPSADGDLSF